MGHDISPIGSHTLDVTDLKSLATDLHQRLKMNIKYGGFIFENHAKLLDIDMKDIEGIYVLGRLIDDPTQPIYTLIDENYTDKRLFRKFGVDIFRTNEYSIYTKGALDKQEAENRVEELNYANYTLEYQAPKDFEFLRIYNQLYDNRLFYYSRWFGFGYFFENFDKLEPSGIFSKYRLNNARIAQNGW